jgi:cbb3-type cytochrome oxidase subunit 3
MPVIQFIQHNSVVLMLTVFVLIVLTTFWPGRRQRFDRDGNIPLDDDR